MTEMGNINDSEQAMEAETAPAAFQRQMGRGLSEDSRIITFWPIFRCVYPWRLALSRSNYPKL